MTVHWGLDFGWDLWNTSNIDKGMSPETSTVCRSILL